MLGSSTRGTPDARLCLSGGQQEGSGPGESSRDPCGYGEMFPRESRSLTFKRCACHARHTRLPSATPARSPNFHPA